MRAYPMDLRVRVLAACDAGDGTAEVADAFAVSPAWVRRVKQRRREAGGVGPRTPARPGPALAPHAGRLLAAVRESPGLTAAEYRDRLGVAVSWRAEVMPVLDPARVVFLDETRAKANMARTRGYAPRGERRVEAVPHDHWHTTTFGPASGRTGLSPRW